MLEVLNFVKGAVGKKDLVPALTHFHIADGRISGFNGKISISSPIDLDIDCCPKADAFVRAIAACEGAAQLHLTATGRLAVRSGKFRAHVDTVPHDGFPLVEPEGVFVPNLEEGAGKLLPAFKVLHDFIGEDASRPWATGVLLDGCSAFATNNVIAAEKWLGYHFPFRVAIPRYAVKEILRIGEEPISIQLTALNATFHYSNDRWLRTQLVSADWPDIRKLMDMHAMGGGFDISDEFWAALETIKPFVDETAHTYLSPNSVSTATEEGATVEVPDADIQGIYNHNMLRLLEGLAKRANWSAYPSQVAWYGEDLRGLIIGFRQQ